MAWKPDRRSNFFFSPPAHLCAVTYMTEISLIVTLNNQFNNNKNVCSVWFKSTLLLLSPIPWDIAESTSEVRIWFQSDWMNVKIVRMFILAEHNGSVNILKSSAVRSVYFYLTNSLRLLSGGRRKNVTMKMVLKFITGSEMEPVLEYTIPPSLEFVDILNLHKPVISAYR